MAVSPMYAHAKVELYRRYIANIDKKIRELKTKIANDKGLDKALLAEITSLVRLRNQLLYAISYVVNRALGSRELEGYIAEVYDSLYKECSSKVACNNAS